MTTSLNHIALQYQNKRDAEIFFSDILGIPKTRSFTVSADLSKEIFGITKNVDVDVFDNGIIRFEIFYMVDTHHASFSHICIEVESKEKFIQTCKKYKLNPYIVIKGEKKLLFAKDFSNNLYEIKNK